MFLQILYVLVKQCEQVLNLLQVDEMHLFEHVGLELFPVPEIGFVSDAILSDNDAM